MGIAPFWIVFWGALAALAVLGAMVWLIWRPLIRALMNTMVDHAISRMVGDKYTANLFGGLNVMRHVGAQSFFETLMRASQGRPVARPMGSPLHFSPWEQLLFQPVYLRPRLPTSEKQQIDTRVVVGPKAQKPLKLDIPIVIGAMSYGGALSVEAKVALAKGANLAGTATNSGESFLREERDAAKRLILQHHRGLWANSTMNRPELLKHADAIEIQLGQGAQASAAMATMSQSVNEKMREVYGVDADGKAMVSTRFRGVDSPRDFVEMVKRLKAEHPVPVGVKVGVSDYIEEDLAVFLDAGVDFVTVDGAEGGTHGGPPTLQDDVGLPTLHGLVRADDFLRKAGVRNRVTLLAAGQLTTPGKMLKALALGADAVYIGTVAVLAALTDQIQKALPFEPPYDLVMHGASARWNRAFDVEKAARNLNNYLTSCMADIGFVVQSLGKDATSTLDRGDLVALEPSVADLCGVRLAWRPRSKKLSFEANLAAMADGRAAADGTHDAASPAIKVTAE